MGLEKWEAYLFHARQYLMECKESTGFAHVRAHMAVEAADLALKGLYAKFKPKGKLSGHCNPGQLGRIKHELEILTPPEINEAVRRLEPHYNASRYSDDTSKTFECEEHQIGCWHYEDILDDLISASEMIIDWSESLLYN